MIFPLLQIRHSLAIGFLVNHAVTVEGFAAFFVTGKGTELFESSSHASTWGAYLDILAFEFKVSEKFSIGTNVGGIGFASSNYAYSETETYRINQFVCDFSNVIVDFKFYF